MTKAQENGGGPSGSVNVPRAHISGRMGRGINSPEVNATFGTLQGREYLSGVSDSGSAGNDGSYSTIAAGMTSSSAMSDV